MCTCEQTESVRKLPVNLTNPGGNVSIPITDEMILTVLQGAILIGVVRSLRIKFDVNRFLERIVRLLRKPVHEILLSLRQANLYIKEHSPYNTYQRLRPYIDKAERYRCYLTGSHVFVVSVSFLLLVLIGQNRYEGIKGLIAYACAIAIGFGLWYVACLFIARGNELRGK